MRRPPQAPLLLPDRLRAHLVQWRRLTSDRTVLDLVEDGLKLEFVQPPAVRQLGPVFRGTALHKSDLLDTLSKWLDNGAIERVRDVKDHCFSLLFPVQQKGKLRWCLDARYINSHLRVPTVKMYGVREIRNLLPAGCWMASIDLESAYLHVPINRADRRWLAFQALGRRFRFCTMIFGLSPAPAAFTRLLRPLLAELHRRGVMCSIYLDDMIIWAPTRARCFESINQTLDLLESLGLKVNYDKCALFPTQRIKYLGLLWDSRVQRVLLDPDRLLSLRRQARKTLSLARRDRLTVRRLAKMNGMAVAAMPAMQAAHLYRHAMQKCVAFALRTQGGPRAKAAWDSPVALTPSATRELQWWASRQPALCNGRPWRTPPADAVLTADASPWGWGATFRPPNSSELLAVQRLWPAHDVERTSNWKEATAVDRAYSTFKDSIQSGSTLLVRTDNTTTLSILRRFGSRIKSLGLALHNLLHDCVSRRVTLVAEHISGSDNYLADTLSRANLSRRNEWQLDRQVADSLLLLWPRFRPTIDLFASPSAHLHPNYRSVTTTPRRRHTLGAFSRPWKGLHAWIVPPINLINATIGRIQDDTPQAAVVVTPCWPNRAWFSVLAALSADSVMLPPSAARQCPDAPIFRDGAPVRLVAWLIYDSEYGNR
jgi:hypothetical protein